MYESFIPRHLTDPLWERLANARLFITGGTGLFGHWLLDSLTDANQRLDLKIEVTVLTRNPDLAKIKMPNLDHRIRFLKGEVENFEFPKEVFDVIFHMATTSAEETFRGASQASKLRMLYEGTQRILTLAKSSQVKRILFTSSGAVYGNQVCDFVEESQSVFINSLHAESGLALGKGVAEFLLSQASKEAGLEVVIARCFSFVGPGMPMDLHYAIGNFMQSAVAGQPIVIKGDGSAIRSYMFMGDLVWWLLKLLLDGKSGEAYNVGSDEKISILDLAQKIAHIGNLKDEIVIQGQTSYSVGVPARNIYVPSTTKASLELGLELSVKLNESIEKTIHSLQVS
jgi:dTDP-glucose 4,6-dehydratase/UDP-glucose 4-epimerase